MRPSLLAPNIPEQILAAEVEATESVLRLPSAEAAWGRQGGKHRSGDLDRRSA